MIVLDVSLTAAWFFEDEATAEIDAVFHIVSDKGAIVPDIWAVELANTFRTAVRRDRLDHARRKRSFDILAAMPIERDPESAQHAWVAVIVLSDKHNLTVYDATYLELAVRRQIPLATTDKALITAARAEGVPVLP